MSGKKCVNCEDQSEGEFQCNGCEQSFCWKHLPDHRRNIQIQLDTLDEKCVLFKSDWNSHSDQTQLFRQIDQWEKESIDKIQVAADIARDDLRSFIKKSKENFEKSFKQISDGIHHSRQFNHYSEINLNQWTKQLENFQLQIENSFFIRIEEDPANSFISMIKINQNNKRSLDQNEESVKRFRNGIQDKISNERFDQIVGPASLDEKRLLATNGIYFRSFLSGLNSYSIGKHSINLRIEKVQKKS